MYSATLFSLDEIFFHLPYAHQPSFSGYFWGFDVVLEIEGFVLGVFNGIGRYDGRNLTVGMIGEPCKAQLPNR